MAPGPAGIDGGRPTDLSSRGWWVFGRVAVGGSASPRR